MPQLKSPRTIIRNFETKDLAALTEMLTDSEVVRHTGFKTPKSGDEISEHFKKITEEGQWPLGVWAVESVETGELISWFMLKITTTDDPEIGFMTRKKYWGQGFTTEVAKTILDYGFNKLNLKKIIARCDAENKASAIVLERVKMKLIQTKNGTCFFEIKL